MKRQFLSVYYFILTAFLIQIFHFTIVSYAEIPVENLVPRFFGRADVDASNALRNVLFPEYTGLKQLETPGVLALLLQAITNYGHEFFQSKVGCEMKSIPPRYSKSIQMIYFIYHLRNSANSDSAKDLKHYEQLKRQKRDIPVCLEFFNTFFEGLQASLLAPENGCVRTAQNQADLQRKLDTFKSEAYNFLRPGIPLPNAVSNDCLAHITFDDTVGFSDKTTLCLFKKIAPTLVSEQTISATECQGLISSNNANLGSKTNSPTPNGGSSLKDPLSDPSKMGKTPSSLSDTNQDSESTKPKNEGTKENEKKTSNGKAQDNGLTSGSGSDASNVNSEISKPNANTPQGLSSSSTSDDAEKATDTSSKSKTIKYVAAGTGATAGLAILLGLIIHVRKRSQENKPASPFNLPTPVRPDTTLRRTLSVPNLASLYNTQAPKMRVVVAYEPRMDDELRLEEGDEVMVLEEFEDGYAFGSNQRNERGIFPMMCVESMYVPSAYPSEPSIMENKLHESYINPQKGRYTEYAESII